MSERGIIKKKTGNCGEWRESPWFLFALLRRERRGMKQNNMILEGGICVQMNDPGNDHFHDEFEMLYVSKGEAAVTVGHKEYVLSRGSAAFIGKLEEHSIRMLSEDYTYYYLIINSRKLEQTVREPRLISIFRNRPAGFRHVIHMPESAQMLDNSFRMILEECAGREVYFDTLIHACLTQILICAYRREPKEFDYTATDINTEIYNIEKYLEENFMYEIRISDIAEEHHISMNYLTQKFKSLTGFTIKQYLGECRLANAKYMLIHTDAPVQNIAIKCGFNDVNNFIRKFKEETGVTPHKYKENSM